MTASGWSQIAIYCALVTALVVPLGAFMARALDGGRTIVDVVLRPVERGFYGLAGVDPKGEQSWSSYALALLAFNLVGLLVVYALQRLQAVLPLNPQGLAAVDPYPLVQETAHLFGLRRTRLHRDPVQLRYLFLG